MWLGTLDISNRNTSFYNILFNLASKCYDGKQPSIFWENPEKFEETIYQNSVAASEKKAKKNMAKT